jgi:hypothetical protein
MVELITEMQNVPLEVIPNVLSFSISQDLLSWRLVNKEWEVIAKNYVTSVKLSTNTTIPNISNMMLYYVGQSFPNLKYLDTVDDVNTVYWELKRCKHLKDLKIYGGNYCFTKTSLMKKWYKRFPEFSSLRIAAAMKDIYSIASEMKTTKYIRTLWLRELHYSNYDQFFQLFPNLQTLEISSEHPDLITSAVKICAHLNRIIITNGNVTQRLEGCVEAQVVLTEGSKQFMYISQGSYYLNMHDCILRVLSMKGGHHLW